MKKDLSFVPESLQAFFKTNPKIALALSGGCDSAYLLYAASVCGAQLGVYYVDSQFQPAFELADARTLADELGQKLRVLKLDMLADAQVKANPKNRCYHCKQMIFGEILKAAHADGFTAVMDGTNASDDVSDRPGMKALEEMHVVSPLRLCGISKADVRELSRQAGLFTWNKPAYACLATRIPAGMEIEAPVLKKIEHAEARLTELGFSGMRVRISERGARLEVRESQMLRVLEKRKKIIAALEADFSEITLNLQPREEN